MVPSVKSDSAAPHLRRSIGAFAITVCAFVASTLYAEYSAIAVDVRTEAVVDSALPSMERITEARTALRHIEVVSDEYEYVRNDESHRNQVQKKLASARAEFDAALDAYGALPRFEGERAIVQALQPKLRELDRTLERLEIGMFGHGPQLTSLEQVQGDFHAAIERVDEGLKAAGMLNERQALTAGHAISAIRQRQARIAVALDLVSALLALAAGVVALRALRSHSRLERAHTVLASTRADELETFAQRVAHDLVSPLSALSFCLSSVKSKTASDEMAIRRATACVQRARGLVQGIFDFSRAGAKPDPNGRADADDVLRGVLEEVRAATPNMPDVTVEPHVPVVLGCSAGVLTSILTNLLRNAVGYMADSVERRVAVRFQDAGSLVRVEVEDTGPGLPAGMEDSVFEPYVRGAGLTQPGLGLGLSTVRRLVQAHGGALGVRSEVGRGCTFWFEMPCVDRIGRAADNAAE